MKNIFLLLAILSFSVTFAKTASKTIQDNCDEFEMEIVDEKSSFVEESIYIQEFMLMHIRNPFFAQLTNCSRVQQDVANSFSGNPNFTTEQVNEMALGAFMGCMGWLN
uniref:hypothetical protein n=1 Tax=Flavobacterium sp. TaxID=239 RepID=UPI00404B04EA